MGDNQQNNTNHSVVNARGYIKVSTVLQLVKQQNPENPPILLKICTLSLTRKFDYMCMTRILFCPDVRRKFDILPNVCHGLPVQGVVQHKTDAGRHS